MTCLCTLCPQWSGWLITSLSRWAEVDCTCWSGHDLEARTRCMSPPGPLPRWAPLEPSWAPRPPTETRVVPTTPVNIRLESSQERVSESVPVAATPSQAWHGQVLGDGDILGQACPVEKACPGPLGSLVAAGGQWAGAPPGPALGLDRFWSLSVSPSF